MIDLHESSKKHRRFSVHLVPIRGSLRHACQGERGPHPLARSHYLCVFAPIPVLVCYPAIASSYFVSDERFASPYFYYPIIILDTVVLTLSLIVNGNVEADFYLTYFLLIIICCIFEDPKILTAVSVFAPLVYTLLLFRSAESIHPSVFLRLPFLFVVSLFYGYFAQLIRVQKALKEEAEQRNRGR